MRDPRALYARASQTGTVRTFRLRRLTSADVAATLTIQRRSPNAAQWTEQQHAATGAAGTNERGFVVEVDGSVHGFLTYLSAAGETEVTNLAVDPEHRRRGVATALLKGLRRTLTGDIFLEVRATNEAAQALYQHCGFVAVGIRKGYYNNPRDDAVIMKSPGCVEGSPAPAGESN